MTEQMSAFSAPRQRQTPKSSQTRRHAPAAALASDTTTRRERHNTNLNLTGKTALVTAASGGIGTGVAEALAEACVRVAISGRTRASLEMVAETLASRAGGRPTIVVGDVGTKGGPAQIAAEAAAALGGRIDILVNNAGAARPITGEADDAYWEESLTLNFMAARRLTDLVIPAMKAERWGRIISISGALVAPKLNAAAPANAALASWSRTLASELGAYGITVNTIAPGRINTAQILKLHPTEQSRADYIKQNIPAGYFGEPYDIGHLVAFLASPLARFINGAAIPVDGGAARRCKFGAALLPASGSSPPAARPAMHHTPLARFRHFFAADGRVCNWHEASISGNFRTWSLARG